jgi:methylenetetrahydrofolate dehydrogenase (NADP+) / methenyltetrahydrofolate cyclohydrolase
VAADDRRPPLSIEPGVPGRAPFVTVRLEGKPVAEAIDRATRAAVERLPPRSTPPTLASVHRDVDSPFRLYLRRQEKAAASLGIGFRAVAVPPAGGQRTLVATLAALDADPAVDAVLVEHPLPAPYDFPRAVAELRPSKDVDGVGAANLGRLVEGHPIHVPAVARAAVAIARHYGLPFEGEPVAVVGRSETVGLPLAVLLAGRGSASNATVTIAHSKTSDLRAALAGARTIFSCAGRPGLLDRSNIPHAAAVVDVGLSSAPDPTRPGASRAVGDADPVALDGWASALTPVPGGVGPVTVAELMAAVVRARGLAADGGAER